MRHRAWVALVQGALIAPHVELADPERRQRPANALDHERHRRAAGVRGIDARRVRQPLRQLDHVLALVAVVRDRLAARDRLYRFAELAHLRAGVVDVELPLDAIALQREHSRQRVAVGCVARMPDVHRAGRVGRYEFDEDPLGCSASRAPNASPAASACASAAVSHASDMNRLTKPGPATSKRSRLAPNRSCNALPRRSASSRGGTPMPGAISSAAFVE